MYWRPAPTRSICTGTASPGLSAATALLNSSTLPTAAIDLEKDVAFLDAGRLGRAAGRYHP